MWSYQSQHLSSQVTTALITDSATTVRSWTRVQNPPIWLRVHACSLCSVYHIGLILSANHISNNPSYRFSASMKRKKSKRKCSNSWARLDHNSVLSNSQDWHLVKSQMLGSLEPVHFSLSRWAWMARQC